MNNHATSVSNTYFLHSLEVIAKQLGVYKKRAFSNTSHITIDTVHHFQNRLHILLCPLQMTDISQFSKTTFPVLMQLKQDQDWRVVIKDNCHRTVVYHPYQKCNVPLSEYNNEQISKVWQCFPLNNANSISYRFIFEFIVKHFKKSVCIILFLNMLLACAPLLLASLPRYLLNHAYELNMPIPMSIIVLTMLSYLIISYISEMYINKFTLHLLSSALPTLWSRITTIDTKSLPPMYSTELTQVIFDYESSLLSIIPLQLSLLFQVISALMLILYMSFCQPWLAGVAMCLCFFVFCLKVFVIPRQFKIMTKKLTLQSKTANLLTNMLLNIHKIRTANAESYVYARWINACRQIKTKEKKFYKLDLIATTGETLLPIFLLVIFYSLISLNMTVSEGHILLTIILCIGQLSVMIQKMTADATQLLYLLPTLKRVKPLLEAKIENFNQKKWLTNFQGNVRFENVTFRQRDANRLILDNISFDVQPGKFIAFVGCSGAGKSTLFRLLLGFEKPSSGNIIIDGNNLNELALPSLRKHFGVVLQTTSIIPGTIFSNIVTNTSLTLDEAWELADQLGLADEIHNMPMKMFTYISDNPGDSLSGGQKQKILLARALANKPKLLLLDEATSALDNKSQAIVYQYLRSLKITQLVIAHRTSTIKDADEIYVLDGGKIINKGTYQELFF